MIYFQCAVSESVTLVTARKQNYSVCACAHTHEKASFEVLTICFAAFILSFAKDFPRYPIAPKKT